MHEKLVHRAGPTRRAVREQGDQQGDGAADDQRRRNTERLGTARPHSAETAVVLPTTAHACQDVRTQ